MRALRAQAKTALHLTDLPPWSGQWLETWLKFKDWVWPRGISAETQTREFTSASSSKVKARTTRCLHLKSLLPNSVLRCQAQSDLAPVHGFNNGDSPHIQTHCMCLLTIRITVRASSTHCQQCMPMGNVRDILIVTRAGNFIWNWCNWIFVRRFATFFWADGCLTPTEWPSLSHVHCHLVSNKLSAGLLPQLNLQQCHWNVTKDPCHNNFLQVGVVYIWQSALGVEARMIRGPTRSKTATFLSASEAVLRVQLCRYETSFPHFQLYRRRIDKCIL